MKLIKRLFAVLLVLCLGAGGSVFYAFKVEPFRVSVKEYRLNEARETAQQLNVVQFSDLHIKEDFTYLNLRKIVDRINGQNPDIVLFTGDLYDNYAKYNDDENIISELQKIEAKYGKIAVWGNRDYGGGASRQYEGLMENAGFTLLKNETCYIALENGRELAVTGLDDALLGNPGMPELDKERDLGYRILVTHEPDVVERYLDCEYEIALSGHSHGGQVNIPFLPFIQSGAAMSTALAVNYIGGMYELDGNGLKAVFVNTGIGTTHISARFGVVPEITVFHVNV